MRLKIPTPPPRLFIAASKGSGIREEEENERHGNGTTPQQHSSLSRC
jgi:hypothetical protein